MSSFISDGIYVTYFREGAFLAALSPVNSQKDPENADPD